MTFKDEEEKPVLMKENIMLDCKAATPEEAIINAGNLLLKSGYIKSGYIEGMLSRDQKLFAWFL